MPPLRDFVLYALLLLMELLPGFVVLVGTSLLDATSWGYGLFWLLILSALAGLAAGLGVERLALRDRSRRGVLVTVGAVAAGGLSVLIASGAVTFIASAIILGIAYWRGLAAASEPPSHDEVQRRFGYGFGLLFFGILWVVARGIIGERAIWQMLAMVGIAFVVVSMLALVAARVEHVREPGAGRAVAMAVLIQLGAIVLFGVLALQLFALDLAGLLGHATQPFFDGLGRDLSVLLAWIADPVDRFVSLIRPHHKSGAQLAPPSQPADTYNGKRPKHHKPLQSTGIVIAALVVVAAILAGIGYLVWSIIPRRQRPAAPRQAYTERRESAVNLGDLWRGLLALLRGLFRRGSNTVVEVLGTTRTRIWGPSYPSDPVRRAYARVLHRAGKLGLPKAITATPAEFEIDLSRRWPDGQSEFANLTGQYVRRRYGEAAADEREVTEAHARWQNLRHVMRAPPRADQAATAGVGISAEASPGRGRKRPSRPFPRDDGSSPLTREDAESWKPTGLTLVILSYAAPVLVIVVFVVILLLASGRLGA
ncbi:MAG TPA: DUF4129 domain-containing protein [Chloroflexota bacterium]